MWGLCHGCAYIVYIMGVHMWAQFAVHYNGSLVTALATHGASVTELSQCHYMSQQMHLSHEHTPIIVCMLLWTSSNCWHLFSVYNVFNVWYS